MKQFFKMIFASMIGFFLTIVLVICLAVGVLIAAVTSHLKETPSPKNSILHIKLKNQVDDRTSDNPFINFNFSTFKSNETPGLYEILKCLKKAKTDPSIKGIFLDLSYIPSGIATLEEIRNALIDFKKSGKFIYSYADTYTQKAYYLSTISDSIYLNPKGFIFFKGISGQVLFFKKTLQKTDIKMQVIRQGEYKSAVEPFTSTHYSKDSKDQITNCIKSIWNNTLNDISKNRNIYPKTLNHIADNLETHDAKNALTLGLVDQLKYKNDVLNKISHMIGTPINKKLNFISLKKYHNLKAKNIIQSNDNKIAIIFATGAIIRGDDESSTSTRVKSAVIAKAIRKARFDNSIKAVILRVNSPGGSALASEIIWKEVELTKKVKPVVASFGNMAASGGYYISCAATKIVANPDTITGSIGVFALIPNLKTFLDDKLGITVDTIKTNKNSEFISILQPMTDFQKSILQNSIKNIYTTFMDHVAKGRNMSFEQVEKIAQGKIYSGIQAKQLGLIDELGGLKESIKLATKLAKLSNFNIICYPEQENPIIQLFKSFSDKVMLKFFAKNLQEFKIYKHLESIKEMKGIQARIPFNISLE